MHLCSIGGENRSNYNFCSFSMVFFFYFSLGNEFFYGIAYLADIFSHLNKVDLSI